MSDGTPLLPCPFCGGIATTGIYSGSATVYCEGCPASMGGEESTATEAELVAAWNRRTVEPSLPSVQPPRKEKK